MKIIFAIGMILISFNVFAKENQTPKPKICIDGTTFRQIKCEKIIYYGTVGKPDPKQLAEIEKMYPRPPSDLPQKN